MLVLHFLTTGPGVWDTVGSLGMPRVPFLRYHNSRSDNEVRSKATSRG
jgi:hypothetical protein